MNEAAGAPRGRSSTWASIGWLAFIAAVAYAVLLGGGYAGINIGFLRTLSLLVIVVGLVAWALLAWRRPEWRPRTAIWPALLVPYGALVAATLASPFPRLGLEYLAWAVLLVVLYLFLARILSMPYAQARIGALMAGLGLLVTIAYLVSVGQAWLEWWDLLGRVTVPPLRPGGAALLTGGPTVVAPLVVLLAVNAFAGLGVGSAARRVTLAVLAATTAASVLLAASRNVWVALPLALLIVAVGALLAHRDRVARWLADRRVRIGGAAVAIVGLMVLGAMAPVLLPRLTSADQGGRGQYFVTAQRMFEDSPLLGQGPGNWAAQRIAFTATGEPDYYVAHAHNTYVQTLAETGLVGMLAGLVALVAVLWLVAGGLRDADPVRRRWGTAAAFVFIFLGLTALLDSYASLPLALVLAAIPFAFLDGTSRAGISDRFWSAAPGQQQRVHALVTVAVFVAAAVALGVLWRVESIASVHGRAVAAIEEGDWAAAAGPAAEAAADDPDMTPYQVTRGLVAAAAGDWEVAEQAFEAAATTDDLPQSWLNLALARLELDRPQDDVLAAIERGVRHEWGKPEVTLAAAELYSQLAMADEAERAYARLLALAPSLAAEPGWPPRIIEAAMARSRSPWELALMSGDVDRARELAAGSEVTLDDLVVTAWAGDADALGKLGDRALAEPLDDVVTAWAARAYAKTGDAEAADRFRRIAAYDYAGTGELGYEIRVSPPSREPVAGSLAPVNHYGRNEYRRSTPGELLAPDLPATVHVDLAAVKRGDGDG